MGYVGLPLAVLAVRKGYSVIGFDLDEKKVRQINSGISPIGDVAEVNGVRATIDPKEIMNTDINLICVPTPVDSKFNPDLNPLISATKAIKANLKKGAILKVFDPYVKEGTNSSFDEVMGTRIVVLLTDHPQFKELDYSKSELVVDGKNFLDKENIKINGLLKKLNLKQEWQKKRERLLKDKIDFTKWLVRLIENFDD